MSFDRAAKSPGDQRGSTDLLQLYAGIQEQVDAAQAAAIAMRVEGTEPSHALDAYTGRFADTLYGEVIFSAADEGLRFAFGDLNGTVEHWHYDTFMVSFEHRQMGQGDATFTFDASGRASAVEVLGRTFRRVAE